MCPTQISLPTVVSWPMGSLKVFRAFLFVTANSMIQIKLLNGSALGRLNDVDGKDRVPRERTEILAESRRY